MSVLFEILKPLVDFVTSIISNLDYPGVLFLMVLDSAMIPIPSEIILVFSGYLVTTGTFEPINLILVGSVGNVIGSIITYYIGLNSGDYSFYDLVNIFLSRNITSNILKRCLRNTVTKLHY
jgi:membrane protein DedA with SNARE-associated domain